MSLIQGIRTNLLYFSVSLPLVLIGYEFLMFSTTANRGWMFLFVGQILVVPVIFVILALCFSRLFDGSSWTSMVGLVFLTLFTVGAFVVTPIALQETILK